MTERRTEPQTISVSPEPKKRETPVDIPQVRLSVSQVKFLVSFKASLRKQTTEGILRAAADSKLMSRAPPGAKGAIADELARRTNAVSTGLPVADELQTLTWPQLQGMLREVRGTGGQDVVMVEVRRRFRAGQFGPGR